MNPYRVVLPPLGWEYVQDYVDFAQRRIYDEDTKELVVKRFYGVAILANATTYYPVLGVFGLNIENLDVVNQGIVLLKRGTNGVKQPEAFSA